jgi:hypothetical protein
MKSQNDLKGLLGHSELHLLENYRAFEFVRDELPHFYALAEVVIDTRGCQYSGGNF